MIGMRIICTCCTHLRAVSASPYRTSIRYRFRLERNELAVLSDRIDANLANFLRLNYNQEKRITFSANIRAYLRETSTAKRESSDEPQ